MYRALLLSSFLIATVLGQSVFFLKPPPTVAASSNTLNTGLVAFYLLDEASSALAQDSGPNGYHFTTAGDTTQETGATANTGTSFGEIGLNDYQRRTNTGFLFPQTFSVAGCFYVDAVDAPGKTIISVWDGGANIRSWMIRTVGTQFQFWVSTNGTGSATYSHSSTLSAATWYFFCVRRNGTTVKINVSPIVTSTSLTADETFAGPSEDLFTSTADLAIMALLSSGTPGGFWNGNVDHIGVWDVYLSDANQNFLWNNGDILPFASFQP